MVVAAPEMATRLKALSRSRTQCAWCGRVKVGRGYAPEPGPVLHSIDGHSVSHGICPECYARVVAVRRLAKGQSGLDYAGAAVAAV